MVLVLTTCGALISRADRSCRYIDAWFHPLPTLSSILDNGYVAGMESGDHEIAFLCLCTTNVNGFLVGVPLPTLMADAELVVGLIDQYEQHSIKGLFAPWSQMLSDLSGRTQDSFPLREEAASDLRTGGVQDTATSFEIFLDVPESNAYGVLVR